jgi:four helix bundle protein
VNLEKFKERAKRVAKLSIRLANEAPSTPAGCYLANQLLPCGCSVGANYRAACRGRSRAEMAAKLGIVEEEADETLFWLDLLIEEGFVKDAQATELRSETNQVLAMTVASIRTLKGRKESTGAESVS